MKINYSKSLNDISPERAERLSLNTDEKYQTQIEISRILNDTSKRESCLVCQNKLQGSEFIHRSIAFIQCDTCTHIQTKGLPPSGYPFHDKNFSFYNVYPDLNPKEYKNRIKRIYQPKLDWIEEVLTKHFTNEELRQKKMGGTWLWGRLFFIVSSF